MKRLLSINKPQGLTPLQTINAVREKFPDLTKETIGFAGRLDPLAHGVLLLMIGEETTKEKDSYLNLPKEYEFEAVFGMATDTYDVLGILSNATMKQSNNDQNLKTEIENFITSKLGKQIQSYPPYSSKTVNGKPLYLWSREGKLSEIEIPTRKIEIYDFKLLNIAKISITKLKDETVKQIHSVNGDFRQNEIKKKWEEFFEINKTQTFPTARFSISCTSGTYVRSLVNELGIKLGIGATTMDILRTKVGSYTLIDSVELT